MLVRYQVIITFLVVCLFGGGTAVHAQYFFNGSAAATTPNCFSLTGNTASQSGQAWATQQISLSNPFELYASVNFGNVDTLGGSGIAFLFHQGGLLAAGANGSGLGYSGIAPSLAVELDTEEDNNRSDPAFDHVALMSNGNTNHNSAQNLIGPIGMKTGNPDVEDGLDHLLHIKWDPAVNELRVWFDCELRIFYQGNIIQDFFAGFPNVYWGFTGGTSSITNVQTVCIEYTNLVPPLRDTTLCAGIPLQLSVGFGQTYAWSPAAGLNDPTIPNPIATPSQTTQYTVTVSDSCGNSRTHSYLHTIIDSNRAVLSGDSITCLGIPVPLRFDVIGTAPFSVDVFDGVNNTNYQLDSNGNVVGTGQPITVVPGATTTYTITTFTGQGNCANEGVGSATITLDILNNLIVNSQNATCFGYCDGAASIFLPHANSDYFYVWPNLTGGSSKSGLCAGTYNVTVNNGNGCVDSVLFNITQPPRITLAPIPNFVACQNEPISVTANASGGSGNYTYTWSDGSIGPGNVFSDTADRTISVTVTDDNNCPSATQTFTITRTPPLTLTTQVDTVLCIGETILITAGASGGDGMYNYAWSDGSVGNNFISVMPDSTTMYYVSVTDACGSPQQVDSILVVVDEYPIHTYTLNDPACLKDRIVVELDAYNANNRYDIWMGDGARGFFTSPSYNHQYEDTGCYDITLRIRTQYCDSIRTDTCSAFIERSPTASFSINPDTFQVITDFTGTFTNLTPVTVEQTWFLDDFIVSRAGTFTYDFVDTGSYNVTLTMTDTTGCTDTLTQRIQVQHQFPTFFIPNAFTPNGDGKNDSFGPRITERNLQDYSFLIFDRLGSVVFETSNPDLDWDGTDTNNGGECAQGVYVYVIKYLDRQRIFREQTGSVLLYR